MTIKNIYYLLLVLFLFRGTTSAQEWTRVVDALTNVYTPLLGTDVRPTSDGGYLMLGLEEQPRAISKKMPLLSKFNAQGYIEWQRLYFTDLTGGENFSTAKLLLGIGDTAVIAGIENNALRLVQVNSRGDTIWRDNFLTNCGCTPDKLSVEMTPNGQYLLAVAVTTIAGGNKQTLLLQVDQSGRGIKQNTQVGFWVEDIRPTFDGGYIMSGQHNNTPAIRKIDAQWGIEWTKSYSFGIQTNGFNSVVQAADSGYVIATAFQISSEWKPGLFKVSSNGQTIEWKLDTLITTINIGLTGKSQHVIRTVGGNFMYVVDLIDSRSMMPLANHKKAVVAEVSSRGELIDYTLLDPGVVTSGERIRAVRGQEFIMVGSYENQRGYLVKFGQSRLAPHQIRGNFYVDTNRNCSLDRTERKLSNWVLRAEDRQTGQLYYANTDPFGAYEINLPAGQYNLVGVARNNVWTACNTNTPFTATSGNRSTLNFGFETHYSCPKLTIDVSTPYLKACDTVMYRVNYCNDGSNWAVQPKIVLQVDSFMTWLSSTVPATALSQLGYYQINPGNLPPGQCSSFEFEVAVDCQFPSERWMCVQADIEPDSLCGAMFLGWDGSNIEVRGTCVGDSIVYGLYNTGVGDMSSFRNYFVTEDHIMLRKGSYQLPAGDSLKITIPTQNGASYYLQAEQGPSHPYSSYVSGGVTNCSGLGLHTGNGTLSIHYLENDNMPTRSIDCQPVVGNDSSNYKRVAPIGFGAQHLIEHEVDLEYQLRVQNTTGKVIRQVILVDTLATELSPSSIVMGASSHAYTWSLTGAGVLTVVMNNVELKPLEWGFVKFKIDQKAGLPLGTVIYNSAYVSLGGTLLKRTNTTFHTIDKDFIPNNITKRTPDNWQWHTYPNPFTSTVTFGLEQGTVSSFEVSIQDALGCKVGHQYSSTGAPIQWYPTHLPAGVYVYQILVDGMVVGTGKLVAVPK